MAPKNAAQEVLRLSFNIKGLKDENLPQRNFSEPLAILDSERSIRSFLDTLAEICRAEGHEHVQSCSQLTFYLIGEFSTPGEALQTTSVDQLMRLAQYTLENPSKGAACFVGSRQL